MNIDEVKKKLIKLSKKTVFSEYAVDYSARNAALDTGYSVGIRKLSYTNNLYDFSNLNCIKSYLEGWSMGYNEVSNNLIDVELYISIFGKLKIICKQLP